MTEIDYSDMMLRGTLRNNARNGIIVCVNTWLEVRRIFGINDLSYQNEDTYTKLKLACLCVTFGGVKR